MKLQIKLALYNAVSKALIIAAIGFSLPIVLQKVVYKHIDQRLNAHMEKMMLMVKQGGIREIIMDQDCSFSDYNIFKEEFVSIKPLKYLPKELDKDTIFNAERSIENEIVRHRVLSRSFLFDSQLYEIEIGEGLSAIEQLNNTLHQFSLGFLLLVVLLSIFIDVGYAQLLLRPFYKIVNQKLHEVNHPAKFNAVKIHTNTYEFAYLDESIDEMMRKIKAAFEAEKEFITNVSHELLTPISILQSRYDNILSDQQLPDEIAIRIVDSQKTLVRLAKIVKALLYISKIENEQFLKTESFSLKELVHEVIDEIEERIEGKDIRLHQRWDNGVMIINCNRSLIHTMIFNLISNAIKYNKEQGDIYISGERKGRGYELIIKDTGGGINKEHLPFIFDRFKRFRPDDEVSYGLGLPIVKSIAEFHDLRVEVNSESNKGTSFAVLFPPNTVQTSSNQNLTS